MNLLQLTSALELGLIYSLVAMGVYLTFRIIDFPDLTADGSFTLGAAVICVLLTKGCHPLVATLCAVLAGSVAGMITGFLHIRWQIMGLLAGILVMTALYSINLKIMGMPNIALINEATIFSLGNIIFIALLIVVTIIALLTWFFATEVGLCIKAMGCNPIGSRHLGVNNGTMKILTLALSNGLIALSGALFAQSQGFADISMGTGTIIVGLAAVLMGEALFSPQKIWLVLIACLAGSIIYRIALALACHSHVLGLAPSDLNLLTAILVCTTLIIPRLKVKRGSI